MTALFSLLDSSRIYALSSVYKNPTNPQLSQGREIGLPSVAIVIAVSHSMANCLIQKYISQGSLFFSCYDAVRYDIESRIIPHSCEW